MAIALSTPVTGTAQTGFTAPTYPVVADNPPANNAKQYAVSGALGGTQVGVSVHSVSSPFTLAIYKPARFTPMAPLNQNGVLVGNGYNDYAFVLRKGMVPLAGQLPQTAIFTLKMRIPAGADLASPAEIRGALSMLFGSVSQVSAGTGDTLVSGIL
jgi:hypothetical protein